MSVCLFIEEGGYFHLHPIILPLVLCPFPGGTPPPSHNTSTGPRGGNPILLDGEGGSTPILRASSGPKSRMGGVPQGTPCQDWIEVTPHWDWMGAPPPGDWMGYLPCLDWVGVPLLPGDSSRAGTCYVVGGMPLAFTQEYFLVIR